MIANGPRAVWPFTVLAALDCDWVVMAAIVVCASRFARCARLFARCGPLLLHGRRRPCLGTGGPFIVLRGAHVERDFTALNNLLMRQERARKWLSVERRATNISALRTVIRGGDDEDFPLGEFRVAFWNKGLPMSHRRTFPGRPASGLAGRRGSCLAACVTFL